MPTKAASTARRIQYLKDLIGHHSTGESEREAARHALRRVLASNPEAEDAGRISWMFPTTFGARYHRSLGITDVGKILRKEFALRRKASRATGSTNPAPPAVVDPIGDLPEGVKISIRTERGLANDFIRVNLTATPDHWWEPLGPYTGPGPALERVGAEIRSAVEDFNYDGSDGRFDHYDVRFLATVSADGCGIG